MELARDRGVAPDRVAAEQDLNSAAGGVEHVLLQRRHVADGVLHDFLVQVARVLQDVLEIDRQRRSGLVNALDKVRRAIEI